jgi:hypothetical protein
MVHITIRMAGKTAYISRLKEAHELVLSWAPRPWIVRLSAASLAGDDE